MSDDTADAGGNDLPRRVETTFDVHGPATPEDLAALTVVLSALGGGETPTPGPARVWGSAERQVARSVRPTAGAWSRSALPR